MTYKELAEMIMTDMTPEEQDCEAVMSTDLNSYFDVVSFAYTDEDGDVLPAGYPVLVPL
jgi:hypothetical protein